MANKEYKDLPPKVTPDGSEFIPLQEAVGGLGSTKKVLIGNLTYLKSEIDTLIDATLKAPEAYDPTITGNYPLTYDGATIEKGDSFRITSNQIGIGDGGRDVNIEDLLIALTDSPSATVATDWMVAESNRDQATESVKGVAKLSSQAQADAGSDDTTILTPLKLVSQSKIAGIEDGAQVSKLTDLASGSTSVSADVDTVVATFTAATGNALIAGIVLTDDVAFVFHNGDTDSSPQTNHAVFGLKKTANANEFTLNIRHKDGGSASRNFNWSVKSM